MGIRTRIGLVVGMVVAVSTAAPTPANADILDPKSWFDSLDPTKLVGKILDQVFRWMFGATPGELAGKVLKAVIANPDLGGDLFAPLHEGVRQLRPAAVALLVLFLLTGLTYSLATDPSRAGVGVVKRLAVAIVGLVAAPSLFEQFNTFVGYVARAVISTPMVQHSVADGLDAALGGGQIGAVFAGVAMILLFLLLCAKVVILALLAVLYVVTPFVMAACVDPRMSHIAGVWIQSTALVQFVPVAWSLILLAFGAIGGMGNLFGGAGLGSNFVNIAVALTLLAMLVFSIPVMLRMAWIGGFIPSLRGAGTMAWGGAQVAGALGGGGAVGLPALEQTAQSAMDDAAAPPAATGDSRGSAAGPAIDFGATSDDEPTAGALPSAAESTGSAPSVTPGSSAGALAAGAGDDVDAAASPTEGPASARAASNGDDHATEGGPGAATLGSVGSTAGSVAAAAPVGADEARGGGAGDPLPAPPAPVDGSTASTTSSAPTAGAPEAATSATPLAGEGDAGGPAMTTSSTSSSDEGATSVPLALDGGDVRAANTAAPLDALDVAAPEPAPAVTDPEQETPQR